jgi:eukaryotic-like serine/threonine-protein kinase
MDPLEPPPLPPSGIQVLQPRPDLIVSGRFRLQNPLKSGGQASIWIATHLSLHALVAVKFLRVTPDEETLGRFQREARAAASVRSSNIVQILDHGVDRGLPYIVMELLQGEDLATRLRRMGRLPIDDVAGLIQQVARGLVIAHDSGLVHRDLKPENIFLAREGDDEIVKILDFGVAKSLPQTSVRTNESTAEGTLLGTPFYMSPEQARGRSDLDHRSDLWSLGVIVFRCLTAHKPFAGEVLGELIAQVCGDPIPSARGIVPELPPAIDDFFARALARDRAERFQSARELARALAAVASGAAALPGPIPSAPGTPAAQRLPAPMVAPPSAVELQQSATPASIALPPGTFHSVRPRAPSRRTTVVVVATVATVATLCLVGLLVLGGSSSDRAAGAAGSASVTITVPAAPPVTEPGASEAPSATATASASASASVSARPKAVPVEKHPPPPRPKRDLGY